MKDFDTSFAEAKKKYSLPDLDEIADRFEIVLKKEGHPLQVLRASITDRLYDIVKTVEPIIFTREGSDPDVMYEEAMVKDLVKEIFEVYKKLNQLHFAGLKLQFHHSRPEDAKFIKAVFEAWPEIEQKLKLFFEKIELGWKDLRPNTIREESYHG